MKPKNPKKKKKKTAVDFNIDAPVFSPTFSVVAPPAN